jgi:hypothetical protein
VNVGFYFDIWRLFLQRLNSAAIVWTIAKRALTTIVRFDECTNCLAFGGAAGLAVGFAGAECTCSHFDGAKSSNFGGCEQERIVGETIHLEKATRAGHQTSGAKAPSFLLTPFGTAEAVPFQSQTRTGIFQQAVKPCRYYKTGIEVCGIPPISR